MLAQRRSTCTTTVEVLEGKWKKKGRRRLRRHEKEGTSGNDYPAAYPGRASNARLMCQSLIRYANIQAHNSLRLIEPQSGPDIEATATYISVAPLNCSLTSKST